MYFHTPSNQPYISPSWATSPAGFILQHLFTKQGEEVGSAKLRSALNKGSQGQSHGMLEHSVQNQSSNKNSGRVEQAKVQCSVSKKGGYQSLVVEPILHLQKIPESIPGVCR